MIFEGRECKAAERRVSFCSGRMQLYLFPAPTPDGARLKLFRETVLVGPFFTPRAFSAKRLARVPPQPRGPGVPGSLLSRCGRADNSRRNLVWNLVFHRATMDDRASERRLVLRAQWAADLRIGARIRGNAGASHTSTGWPCSIKEPNA